MLKTLLSSGSKTDSPPHVSQHCWLIRETGDRLLLANLGGE